MAECKICPRRCGADRKERAGLCGCTEKIIVAKTMLHLWEEPPISGKSGSGAIFFCGCPLGCVFCQNREISHPSNGRYPEGAREYSVSELSDKCLELERAGANNINFVSPTQYTPWIIEAVARARENGLGLPVVWNTGGYEALDTVKSLEGTVDIFLTDMKYYSRELSSKLSAAPNYFEEAIESLGEMLRIAGKPLLGDDGMMKKGVIVRHLVLPGCREDSLKIFRLLKERYGSDKFLISLMNQYTPDFFTGCDGEKLCRDMKRRLTTFEYNKVLDEVQSLGFDGFIQERTSAVKEFTPKW